jgi:uncharacterized protein YbgA (DUF1722 family)/uncharacterized protein YbbK (DUF523 family)
LTLQPPLTATTGVPASRSNAKHLQIGVSACILGQQVRFDGGHKKADFCFGPLAHWVNFLPICPEMAIGMPSPRPAIRLVQQATGVIHLQQSNNPHIDHTETMQQFAEQMLPNLFDLSGYIVCAKSPTCGMERVRLHGPEGQTLGKVGVGLFTRQLMQRYPWLPVEEDGRLLDADLRENFVIRIFSLYRLQQAMQDGFTVGKLVHFHTQHKFLLLAHHPVAYRALGRLVAQARLFSPEALYERYRLDFMQALSTPATRRNHSNVLMHLMGFFKKVLPAAAKAELVTLIHQYRQGFIPRVAVLTLFKHHLQLNPSDYVAAQQYLQPYPTDLGLWS